MRVCPSCGKGNPPVYKFCAGCGGDLTDDAAAAGGTRPAFATPTPSSDDDLTPLVEALASPTERNCPACGSSAPSTYHFCPTCGADMVTGAPRAAGATNGTMTLIRPDGTDGGVHALVEGENQIGRSAGPLFEADGYLSPVHAELVLNAAGLVLRDANSLNGVFLKIRHEEELYDGDVFRIGQELLRFDVVPPPQPLEDGTDVLGSPNPGYWGRLAIIVGRDQEGSAFPLLAERIQLGRERGDILFPEDGYVSGAHAEVYLRDGRAWLNDLGSSNGTFLRIRGEQLIPPGTHILMGQQLFRIDF